ncbi:MAG: polyphenol oxidase family protein, partial [Treponema sp.]|nr:polyphenol oxidase family protein [Treponema sp.]
DGADENVEDDVDGLMTDKPGVVLATFYADCVPLLFCDPARRVVATSHSGWKGCAGNMAARTVARMGERYGCDPADILAGIGPCISRANYEVGSEVAERFAGEFASCFFSLAEKPGKYLLDLREACRLGLLSAGLRGRNIDVAPEGMCAFACREMFFSHRRDGSPRGSLAALIALDL